MLNCKACRWGRSAQRGRPQLQRCVHPWCGHVEAITIMSHLNGDDGRPVKDFLWPIEYDQSLATITCSRFKDRSVRDEA